jgi:hypothetical protein
MIGFVCHEIVYRRLQHALQYDTMSHTNNGNFGGVLAGKHHVIIPSLKSWNLISLWTDYWRDCQLLAGVRVEQTTWADGVGRHIMAVQIDD